MPQQTNVVAKLPAIRGPPGRRDVSGHQPAGNSWRFVLPTGFLGRLFPTVVLWSTVTGCLSEEQQTIRGLQEENRVLKHQVVNLEQRCTTLSSEKALLGTEMAARLQDERQQAEHILNKARDLGQAQVAQRDAELAERKTQLATAHLELQTLRNAAFRKHAGKQHGGGPNRRATVEMPAHRSGWQHDRLPAVRRYFLCRRLQPAGEDTL